MTSSIFFGAITCNGQQNCNKVQGNFYRYLNSVIDNRTVDINGEKFGKELNLASINVLSKFQSSPNFTSMCECLHVQMQECMRAKVAFIA